MHSPTSNEDGNSSSSSVSVEIAEAERDRWRKIKIDADAEPDQGQWREVLRIAHDRDDPTIDDGTRRILLLTNTRCNQCRKMMRAPHRTPGRTHETQTAILGFVALDRCNVFSCLGLRLALWRGATSPETSEDSLKKWLKKTVLATRPLAE